MILSHPFRLDGSGAVAVVEDGSTRANAEAIAVLAGTRRGERILQPLFGMTDPAFGRFDGAELRAGLAQFGPDAVEISDVVAEPVRDGLLRVRVTFTEEETDLV